MKLDEICAEMPLEDKIALGSGKDFWHTKEMQHYDIPSIMVADGPHGLRKQPEDADMLGINKSVEATCFPTAVSSACSWDIKLIAQVGEAIAKEAKANGVSVILGPGANIKRNPLCGRNFEYFSEDPYLTGKMAASFIKGVQSTGIGTSVKHFAMNNQEYKRFSSDSIVDEKTMREIYLSGFEIAVREGKPASVMCCYNKINGTYGSDNKQLLTDILRKEWGYEGLVITDWGAMNNRIKAYEAGCDLSMPGGSAYMEKECVEAVKNGTLSEEYVNSSVKRVIRLAKQGVKAIENAEAVDMQKHFELARKTAEESAVLLKNEGQILPLQKKDGVAFIGHMAQQIRYQGAGSSHINPWKVVNAIESCPDVKYATGCRADGSTCQELLDEACRLAAESEIAVVFAGLTDSYEAEGFDRETMKMPDGHIELIEAVASKNSNTIVVLMCGSVVEVPWIDKVKALLYMGLPGEAGGEAIVNLLFGTVNPSGKLAETWPILYEDCVNASYYGKGYKDAQYREGIYVGYRYYQKANVPVRFPFGFGLSYTNFTYRDLKVEGRTVTCKIKNTGNVLGKEIVQLYIEYKGNEQYRPLRELKSFIKVELKPKEEKLVRFQLNGRSFAIWENGWTIPSGVYAICIGSSSEKMELTQEIPLMDEESQQAISEKKLPNWYYNPKGTPTQKEFEQLIGRSIVEKTPKKGEFTMENTVIEMKEDSVIMKILYKVIEKVVAKGFGGKPDYENPSFKMMFYSAADCSLTGIKVNTGMNNYLLEGLLEIANGRLLKGLKMILKRG